MRRQTARERRGRQPPCLIPLLSALISLDDLPASGHSAPSARFRRVRYEDLRVEIAAELALQSGPQVGKGRATIRPLESWENLRCTEEDQSMDIAALANLLHETSEHHGHYEEIAPKHDWWDWYAAYMAARESGRTPEEASEAARVYMEEARGIHIS